jgi:hypothetical protein
LHEAARNEELRNEKSQREEEKDPKKAHLDS